MITRATTVGTLKGYRTNLNSSINRLNSARDTVLSQRLFNSYAEDPATAARAFQLRRSRMSVESQYAVADDTYRKYQSAWGGLLTVVNDVDNETKNSVKEAALRALNDPTGDARAALGKELNELADTIVQTMNNRYGETFLFAGADGSNVPFTWKGEQLCYRGVPVDASISDVAKEAKGDLIPVGADGKYDENGTNYIKGKTSLVTADELETNPPLLKDENGKRIMVDDTTGQQVSTGGKYVNTDATSLISTEEYANAPSPAPKVLNDGTTPVQVNAEGEIDPAGGFYLVLDDTGALVEEADVNITSQLLTNGSGDALLFDKNGNIITDGGGNPVTDPNDPAVTAAGGEVYYMSTEDTEVITKEQYDEEVENVEKLNYMSTEGYYVDIGLGFKEDEKNELIKTSGFNAALQGINFLGYGLDEDGDPKNIVSLVKQMAKICTDGDGKLSASEYDELNRLTGKMEDAASELHTMHDDMDAATNKLKNNMALLEDNFYTLQEQYAGLEDVDMADSITSFVWAQYCYNAALKVGNSVLSESLIDYMS